MNEICPTEALSVLLNTAFQKRKDLFSDPDTDAFRMFNGFCEGFPSFSIDRYAGTAVILWTDKKAVPGSGLLPFLSRICIESIPGVESVLFKNRFGRTAEEKNGVLLHGEKVSDRIREWGVSYPVGKTDELRLYPLSFAEFVRAKAGEALYERLIHGRIEELSGLRTMLSDLLREYYFTGGMPEVVREYLAGRAYEELRGIQKQILADYALDISKHASSSILGRIHQVWNSIPQQLAKRNSKFFYGDVQKGARAKDFEAAIQWLLDAGVIYRIPRVRKAGIPLKYYEDFSAFKLYLLDHGLMGAMTDAPIPDILLNKNVFEEYDGTFTDQYVLEQLICSLSTGIYYYDSDTGKLEIDFLIQGQSQLIPIEVKAGENLRSKSLKTFYESYPNSSPVRLSMSDYRQQEWMVNLPLYAADRVRDYE